jgi:hypothetical protein
MNLEIAVVVPERRVELDAAFEQRPVWLGELAG